MTDGDGNLLAAGATGDPNDPDFGFPVAHDVDNNVYVFLAPGEPSHNERHSSGNLLEMVATQSVDPDLPGYAGEERR